MHMAEWLQMLWETKVLPQGIVQLTGMAATEAMVDMECNLIMRLISMQQLTKMMSAL